MECHGGDHIHTPFLDAILDSDARMRHGLDFGRCGNVLEGVRWTLIRGEYGIIMLIFALKEVTTYKK